ncbi:CNR2 [Branchiostoma lanceolatum]|uniref:CNR2 protein n=1 Tax=Branchiostoma lanceolatum TaxID=7740 RepID=A0A8K0ERP6_BRALA|nr:CNR2 [Branchiostoma lanceolatum]
MEGNFSDFNATTVGFAHPHYNTTGQCFEWYAESDAEVNLTFQAIKTICGTESDWAPFAFRGREEFIIAISVVCILLNGLVIFGIAKGQQHTPLYYLIGNLAVIDIITNVVVHVMFELRDSVTYRQFMLLIVTVLHFPVILSLTGLVLLSVDRYISVRHAIFYHYTVRGGHVLVAVAGAWVSAALLCFSPMMGWNCKAMGTSDQLCFLGAVESSYIQFMTVLCMTGVCVVVFTNVRVFAVLRRRLTMVGVQEQHQGRVHIHRQQIAAAQKKAKSVLLMIVVFLIAWLPFLSWQLTVLVSIHNSWDGLVGINQLFRCVFLIVIGLVPIVNPFVYAFRLPALRRVVWDSIRNGGIFLWRRLAPPQQVHPTSIEMSILTT